jgi:hypothetical protein
MEGQMYIPRCNISGPFCASGGRESVIESVII